MYKFRLLADVLAVLAGAPQSSMYVTTVGNGLQLVLCNLLLTTFGQEFSALPGFGVRQATLRIS